MSVPNVGVPSNIPPIGDSPLSPAEAAVQALGYLGYLGSLCQQYIAEYKGGGHGQGYGAEIERIEGIIQNIYQSMPSGSTKTLIYNGLSALEGTGNQDFYAHAYVNWAYTADTTGQTPLEEASALIGGASALYSFNSTTSPDTIFAVLMFYVGLNQESSFDASGQLAELLGQAPSVQGFTTAADLGTFLALYVQDKSINGTMFGSLLAATVGPSAPAFDQMVTFYNDTAASTSTTVQQWMGVADIDGYFSQATSTSDSSQSTEQATYIPPAANSASASFSAESGVYSGGVGVAPAAAGPQPAASAPTSSGLSRDWANLLLQEEIALQYIKE